MQLTVVVKTKVVWRAITHQPHELIKPGDASIIVGTAWTAKLLAFLCSQLQHLVVPSISRLLRRNAIPLRLVEVDDDGLVSLLNRGPVLARKLGHQVDHGSKWRSPFELGWYPCVPVTDRGEGAGEGDLIHHLGDIVGVCVVPEEHSLFDSHCGG